MQGEHRYKTFHAYNEEKMKKKKTTTEKTCIHGVYTHGEKKVLTQYFKMAKVNRTKPKLGLQNEMEEKWPIVSKD